MPNRSTNAPLSALAAAVLVVGCAAATADTVPAAASTPQTTTASRSLHVSGAGAEFNTSLPPSSVATYVWTPGGSAVQEYLTSTAGTSLTQKLQRQSDIPTPQTATGGSTSISVDPSRTGQTMTGFGGALTDSAATLINQSPNKAAILDALFGAAGARFNFVRVPMGATDLIASNYQSYDDSPLPDPQMSRFTIAHDTANIIPVLQQAKARQPSIGLLGTPWSAPAWMKYGGTYNGTCGPFLNSLNPDNYQAYADYFVKFTQAYAAYGLPMSMVSMQNEPQNCTSSYPTMNMTASEQAAFSGYLRSALNAAGFGSTGILAWDHNWYDEGTPKGGPATTYPDAVLAAAGANIAAIGYHCYNRNGDVNAFSHQTRAAPVYMTECSGFVNQPNAAGNLVDELRYDLIGPIRNGAKGSLYWSMALGNDGNPHVGGCATCRGMVGIDRSTGNWAPNEDYYYWAHFSKFVQPGAVRIDSTDLGNGSIETVAFRNPDGTVVLVALNAASSVDYRGHIVQWDGDNNTPKTSWLVGPDGARRWISDTATYKCLKTAGFAGPNVLTSGMLDNLPDQDGVWAVCGQDRIGVGSMLQAGSWARSQNRSYTLRLSPVGLTLSNSSGASVWSTGRGGDDLTLQGDGNLVEYSNGSPVWSSGTVGSGAMWLVVLNTGKLALYDANGAFVWTSEGQPSDYTGHIVQWDGDTNSQKTSWLVGPDGRRRWIHDTATYGCLRSSGAPGPNPLTSWMLDKLPDTANVWAVCGADRIGTNSMLQTGFYARSLNGSTTLRLTGSDLAVTNRAGTVTWNTGVGGSDLVLQSDGNLVEYSGSTAVWASDTVESGAQWLVVGNDGKLALYDSAGAYVWTSEGPPSRYTGHIVQWAGDTKKQKTSWLVTPDGHRNWIPSIATYNCLKQHGAPGPDVLTSWELNQLPDVNGVQAHCV